MSGVFLRVASHSPGHRLAWPLSLLTSCVLCRPSVRPCSLAFLLTACVPISLLSSLPIFFCLRVLLFLLSQKETFFFFLTCFLFVSSAVAVLELTKKTRLALNSQRFTCSHLLQELQPQHHPPRTGESPLFQSRHLCVA